MKFCLLIYVMMQVKETNLKIVFCKIDSTIKNKKTTTHQHSTWLDNLFTLLASRKSVTYLAL